MSQKHRRQPVDWHSLVDSALSRARAAAAVITVAQECRNPRVLELVERAREAGIRVVPKRAV